MSEGHPRNYSCPLPGCLPILTDMERSLGRIEAKLLSTANAMETLTESHKKLALRVENLEGTRTYLRGIWTAVGAAWATLLYVLVKIL